MEFTRDLASADVWAESLERSLARRGRPRRASLELGRLTQARDLADPDTVNESAVYWRTRRAAGGSTSLPAPAVGGVSVLALLAASTLPALASGSTTARKGGVHSSGSAAGSGTTPAHTIALRTAPAVQRTFTLEAATPASTDAPASTPSDDRSYTLESTVTPANTYVLGASTEPAPSAPAATTIAVHHPVVYGKVTRGDLRDAQRMLGIGIDDVLGPKTGAAIRAFQSAHGLKVDGVVGPSTWAALKTAEHAHTPAATPAASPAPHAMIASVREASSVQLTGSPSTAEVIALQQALGISADGTFGSATVTAVEAFQSAHGLDADGVVGPSTRDALGLGSGPTLQSPQPSGGVSDPATTPAATPSTDSATPDATVADSSSDPTSTATTSTGPSTSVSTSLSEMIAAANQIATLPYIFGGGHGSFVAPGYDCSGSVSYVLHAAGLLSVPEDSSALESYGAPGPGQYITIYANAGHAWMTIEGRRYDTVALSSDGSRWGSGGGEFAGFVVRHPVGF